MFKRNPDAVALVAICLFLVIARAAPEIRRPVQGRGGVRARLHRTVASFKQCIRLRLPH